MKSADFSAALPPDIVTEYTSLVLRAEAANSNGRFRSMLTTLVTP